MASTSTSTSDAALKLEIARLTGAINRHKSLQQAGYQQPRPRSNVYINPNYNVSNTPAYVRPSSQHVNPAVSKPSSSIPPKSSKTHDVVIGGVAFQSSGRSLVRKDLTNAAPSPSTKIITTPHIKSIDFTRTKAGHLIQANRLHKPQVPSRGRRGRPVNRNMTLNNSRRSYQDRRSSVKKLKYVDKPCPRFTTTGTCSRGLTCMYQHDSNKIAICWNFLQGNCSNTAETCNLSHDPTPERTPLCLHFANNARCTRENCPFPHVRVGRREGVCRDFAVLGYCEKGLECDKQHVRECPDYAEKGTCTTKGCKLPHVIRANRTRKPPAPGSSSTATSKAAADAAAPDSSSIGVTSSDNVSDSQYSPTAEDAQMGDEFISLTFNESDDESEGDDEDSDIDVDVEEGNDPTSEQDEQFPEP